MSTFAQTRDAMCAEFAAAVEERDCSRVVAAAVWLRTTGLPLLDIYEQLLVAALRSLPAYARTPAEHVHFFELQQCVRDIVARLSDGGHSGTRGQVLVVVPEGSHWVLGTAPLTHLLTDAGFDVVTSPDLGLDDVEPLLEGLDEPVGLCLALHSLSSVPRAREVVRAVRAGHPQVRVLVGGLAQDGAPDLAGLVGGHTTIRTLRETLDALTGGDNPLSPRELAVLRCVAQGMSNPDAGQHLGVAAATVKTHLDRVYAKLGTSDRTATVALAMRRGWIE
ncbi:MAG TPA: LuxR C-terminal-related transcriptional regulator [Mycobacteriales bacterium]|nr:LuxR C-terminal-related transcriptional regulator [Mycobacteriales bacterium]